MTGVGVCEIKNDKNIYSVEVKSVNNRYLEVSCRIPSCISGYEAEIREIVRESVHRGKVYLNITIQGESDGALGLRVDPLRARAICQLLEELQKVSGIREDVRLEHLLKFSEIFDAPKDLDANAEAWKYVRQALDGALKALKTMRAEEGKALSDDILNRIGKLEEDVLHIEKTAGKTFQERYEKMVKRIQAMIQDTEIDADRLNTEVALMANKMDVTEECVRLHSHHRLFHDTLKNQDVVGKKLNFLLQEMNREANTVSAKANNAEISHVVVSIKEEIEKLREQVQNLE